MANPKYAIIGAGPSGLAMAKILRDKGIAFHGYEASSGVGGLWDISRFESPLYPSTHLISSKRMTEFKVFPMRDDVPDFPHHSYVIDYFNSFAEQFKLNDFFSFNTRINAITKCNSGWDIKLENGEIHTYKGVILATGTFSKSKLPKYADKFEGEWMHSKNLKSFDFLKDKRVLVVGGGNSGCDIAVEASRIAESVCLSVDKGNYFVPKYIKGKPYDTLAKNWTLPRFLKQRIDSFVLKNLVGDISRFGFPKPKHKMYQLHPVVNTQVLYQIGHGHIEVCKKIIDIKGTSVQFANEITRPFDVIIYATGYQLSYPYINNEYLNWQGYAPKLYLNIFNPKYPSLTVLGMVEATGLGWQGRYEQALLIASYIDARIKGKKSAIEFEQKLKGKFPDTSAGYGYLDTPGMAYYVNKSKYKTLLKKATLRLMK